MNKRQRKKNITKSCPYIVAKKIKPNEIMLFQIDMNDDNFEMGFVCELADHYFKCLPKESSIILMPDYMTVHPMDKEVFRKFLDVAEEFYQTLQDE